MEIPVELCLELLVAADYLGLDSMSCPGTCARPPAELTCVSRTEYRNRVSAAHHDLLLLPWSLGVWRSAFRAAQEQHTYHHIGMTPCRVCLEPPARAVMRPRIHFPKSSRCFLDVTSSTFLSRDNTISAYTFDPTFLRGSLRLLEVGKQLPIYTAWLNFPFEFLQFAFGAHPINEVTCD